MPPEEQNLEPAVLHLPTKKVGKLGAEKVVLAHGFTQNSRCWYKFADLLAEQFELVLVDLPGHGEAPVELDEVRLQQAGHLLLAAAEGEPAHFVGYSMGGRIAMHAAIDAPELVQSLTLIGAHPGLVAPELRKREDIQKANSIERLGLEAFIDDWLMSHMFVGLSEEAKCIEQRLSNRAEGLAASLRHRGLGSQEHLELALENVDVPMMLLVGQSDTRFISLISQLDLKLKQSSLRLVPGGHAAHLASPQSASQVVAEFINSAT